jgi:hypothetical protein
VSLPPALQPWVQWVTADDETLPCALVGESRTCVWPGRLSLELDDRGGRFTLEARLDAGGVLPLPGDLRHWPRDLVADGRPATLAAGKEPAVRLSAGEHRVSGRFEWARLPESIFVPPLVALVDLQVRGSAVPFPRREEGGSLWLMGASVEATAEDRVSIDVYRRFDDRVPVTAITRLALRISGKSREHDLGRVLPEGWQPVSLSGPLPSRIDGGGNLRVQIRPGTWTLELLARSPGPVAELAAPQLAAPWPGEEFWVFAATPEIRSVKVEGAVPVDPQRTSIPEEWRALPAWRVARGEALRFVELRRGAATPPPDDVTVARELWLDDGGRGFLVRDALRGTLHDGGRLGLLAPGVLGHVTVGQQERVINQLGSGPHGVELRDEALIVLAESSYGGRGELPAVGWDRDASSLSATLRLPPGWTLLGTRGVDEASGTWLDRWSLLDLFFLLLTTLAAWRLLGVPWAALGFVVLGLSWHEPSAPRTWWLLLLALGALLTVLQEGRAAKAAALLRWALLFGLAVHATIFAWGQIRTGLFPQLEHGGAGPISGGYMGWDASGFGGFGVLGGAAAPPPAPQEMGGAEAPTATITTPSVKTREEAKPAEAPQMQQDAVESAESPGDWDGRDRSLLGLIASEGYAPAKRSAQIDPKEVVQTGPGLPRWSWNQHALTWNGPVAQSHSMRFFLLAPWAEGFLSIFRVLGIVLLALRLGDPRRAPRPRPREPRPASPGPGPAAAAAGASLTALLGMAAAGILPAPAALAAEDAAFPGPDLLGELETRLSALPDCAPDCVQTAALSISGDGSGLRVEAELHAAAAASWALPGPDSVWIPARVSLDGEPVSALRRDADGTLLVRVPAGIHRLSASGAARDVVALQFGGAPRVFSFSGEGWSIDGWRPDEAPPSSVQLSRSVPLPATGGPDRSGASGSDGAGATPDLPPWLELRRELDIGIPWMVHNRLVRLGPEGSVIKVRVPLLPGESVTTPEVPVEGTDALLTLEGRETQRAWDSTLSEAESLPLLASSDRPFTEVWTLDCSALWHCAAEGLPPTRLIQDGRWKPRWEPWPGESMTLRFARPSPAEGATSTVDAARLALVPGRRVVEGTLDVELRSSQGGEQWLELPESAQIVAFTVDQREHPTQRQGARLTFALEPGNHAIQLRFRLDHETSLRFAAPELRLGAGAANVQVSVQVPENKWLLWAQGPRWGAVVTAWQYVLLLLLAAGLLGRFAPTPLRARHWFLLGLGMTQVPMLAPIVVVLWFVALGLRGRAPEGRSNWYVPVQLGLLGLSALAFGMLWWSVQAGLLVQPDMQVEGAGSYGGQLQWYEPRTDGTIPRPWLLWAPLLVWRGLMLLWALWLAVQLAWRWVPWAWRQITAGGFWRLPGRG